MQLTLNKPSLSVDERGSVESYAYDGMPVQTAASYQILNVLNIGTFEIWHFFPSQATRTPLPPALYLKKIITQ